jgi:hypothetical protein
MSLAVALGIELVVDVAWLGSVCGVPEPHPAADTQMAVPIESRTTARRTFIAPILEDAPGTGPGRTAASTSLSASGDPLPAACFT